MLSQIAHIRGWVLYSPFEAPLNNEGYVLNDRGPSWRSPSDYNLSHINFFWSSPEDATSLEGLSGGISWAMHPDFCPSIIPKFREEQLLFGTIKFMTCDSLRNAIDTALRTWSSNHPHLSFSDVTDACVDRDLIDADGYCPGAEVTISTQAMDGPKGSLAAFVVVDGQDIDRYPRTTAGVTIDGGLGIRRAHLKMATSLCWYLDTTFCSAFYRLELLGWGLPDAAKFVLGMIFLIASLSVLRVMLRVVLAGYGYRSLREATPFRSQTKEDLRRRARRSKTMRWGTMIEYMTNLPMLGLLLALFVATFVPIFYTSVYLPCTECYGFSSTVAHEAGHLLGFHHVDVLSNLNLRATAPMGEATCQNPLAHVELVSLAEDAKDAADAADNANVEKGVDDNDTIMKSVAAHRSTTCLTADDLEGLNFVYPQCDARSVSRMPVCTEPHRLTGYLRLLVAVAIPFSLVTFIVLGVQNVVRSCQRRHVKLLRAHVRRQSQQATWLRASVRATWAAASTLSTPRGTPKAGGARRITRRKPVATGQGGERLVSALFGATMRSLIPGGGGGGWAGAGRAKVGAQGVDEARKEHTFSGLDHGNNAPTPSGTSGLRPGRLKRPPAPPATGGLGNPPLAVDQKHDSILTPVDAASRDVSRPPRPPRPPPPTRPTRPSRPSRHSPPRPTPSV